MFSFIWCINHTELLTCLGSIVLGRNVPIKTIFERTGRAKSTIMKVLSLASGLAYNVVPVQKYGGGRQKKTSNATDCLLKRELKKDARLTASQLKSLHPDLLSNVSVRTIQHRLQKDLGLPSRTAAKKPLINDMMKEQRLSFAKKHAHWTPT